MTRTIGNNKIEHISAIEAQKRGYLLVSEYMSHVLWVAENFEDRKNKYFVYVNGQYTGMADKKTLLADLITQYIK